MQLNTKHEGTSWEDRKFYVMIEVVFTLACMFIKGHLSIPLQYIDFIMLAISYTSLEFVVVVVILIKAKHLFLIAGSLYWTSQKVHLVFSIR